ncbi:hypothetical protein MHYP_G00014390 [Metynnis hypsauchen]
MLSKCLGVAENIIQTIMATRRPARIPEDLAQDMILNGWDEEPIGGIDSGSDISDVEYPEYFPSGHVRLSETQSAPAERDQSDTEEASESSEEEMDIVSNRMSRIKFDVLQTHGHTNNNFLRFLMLFCVKKCYKSYKYAC